MCMFEILLLSVIPSTIGLTLIFFSLIVMKVDTVDPKVRTYDFEKTKMKFIIKK